MLSKVTKKSSVVWFEFLKFSFFRLRKLVNPSIVILTFTERPRDLPVIGPGAVKLADAVQLRPGGIPRSRGTRGGLFRVWGDTQLLGENCGIRVKVRSSRIGRRHENGCPYGDGPHQRTPWLQSPDSESRTVELKVTREGHRHRARLWFQICLK